MTREEKIDKIVVGLFAKILGIEDEDILGEIEDSIRQKDIKTKERILADLYEKSNAQDDIISKMHTEIKQAKSKIEEGYESYFENKEIDNLLA